MVNSHHSLHCRQETFQLQKRLEVTRAYGLSKKEDEGEIPDDDFKTFMAIAR